MRDTLKYALKRGALIAAANWPVVIVQEVADSLFKLLVAVPLIGGIFLVALVLGAEPVALMSLGWRDLAATIVASLISRPAVLAAFLAALGVVIVGGSLFVFLIKAGTVSVLVRGDRAAGPVERPPLHFSTVMTASAFSIRSTAQAAASRTSGSGSFSAWRRAVKAAGSPRFPSTMAAFAPLAGHDNADPKIKGAFEDFTRSSANGRCPRVRDRPAAAFAGRGRRLHQLVHVARQRFRIARVKTSIDGRQA